MPKDKINIKHNRTIKVQLSTDVNVASTDSADSTRAFEGVAHSGKPFSYGGMMSIVEISSITHHEKLPVLLLHDRAQRAGFGTLNTSDRLNINGYLLSNQHGRDIAQDADDGFPWQLSAHLESQTIDELAHGETETVNGQLVTGPMLILRNSFCYEVSFTPTGVDNNTYALVLSDDGANTQPLPTPLPVKKDTTMTPEEIAALQKLAADQAEEIKQLKEEKAELEKEKAEAEEEAKVAAVEAQLSQAGFTKTEDGKGWNGVGAATVNMLLSASADDAKEMIGDLRAPSTQEQPPGYLFGEQHKPSDDGQGGQDRKLSDNPLIADALSRANSQGSHYI